MGTTCVPSEIRRVSNSPQVKLQTVVSRHVDAGNQTQVLCKEQESLTDDPSHRLLFILLVFCFVLFFESGFLCVAPAVLELALDLSISGQPGLQSEFQGSQRYVMERP